MKISKSCMLLLSCLVFACLAAEVSAANVTNYTISNQSMAQFNVTSSTHPPSVLPIRSGPLTVAANFRTAGPSQPAANYDQQLWNVYDQAFSSLSFNVVATQQSDVNNYGPAYLLNGLTTKYYWYQAGITWNWTLEGGGHVPGFQFVYDVFNALNNSVVLPAGCQCGGGESFSGQVNQGDTIQLTLTFVNGNVVIAANDLNTGAYESVYYSALGSSSFQAGVYNGYFTGLMTEQYHALPYFGTEQPVYYSLVPPPSNTPSTYMYVDEWVPANDLVVIPTTGSGLITYSPPNAIQSFSVDNAIEYSNATEFITGNYPLTVQTPQSEAVDVGQTAAITAPTTSNGLSPYSYQWYEKKPGQSSFNGASDCGSGNSQSSSPVSCTFSTTSSTTSGNYLFELQVTDAASSQQNSGNATSSPSNIMVSSQPSATLLRPSNSVLDYGQYVTYNILLSGGTSPFTANLVVSGSTYNTITGSSAGTVSFNAVKPSVGTYSYNVIATDLGTASPYVFNSVSNTITVNQQLASPLLWSSNVLIDQGQAEKLTYSISGGTPNYQYVFTASNSINGNVIATQTFNGVSLTTN
ncbi:MAG TPA: hypothetical protein VL945_02450, partial [Candidatus Saccharimonadales bacterium]|nr:hypothetical protein [Candidatus Saccharimonadales bacterium]